MAAKMDRDNGQLPPPFDPDYHWILFHGGDPASETCHRFLLDVADLGDSQGIGPELLSPTGEHERV